MTEPINLIWDITGEGEVIAITDNDHDTLRFILAHNDIYPWAEGVKQDAHALWRGLLNAEITIEDVESYFDGIAIEQHHLNYDYIGGRRTINTVADEAGVDEFDVNEV